MSRPLTASITNNGEKMKRTLSLLLLFLGLGCTAGASAQLYKSIGPDGKVTYSDTPPATSQIEKKLTVRDTASASESLPYELAEAVKKNPVTLYTTTKCKPCDDGRKLLSSRGIPFAEKTVNTNDDLAVLHQAGGDQQLPLLTIGHQAQQGFDADTWNMALGALGYPEASKLPKTYHNPPAVAAAPPKPVPENKVTQASESGTPQPAPPSGNAPPGFRF